MSTSASTLVDLIASTVATNTPTPTLMGVVPNNIWMIIVGFLISFVLAFGIGANDVANSFGTSVGSKVLTLLQACILASVFETAGAILLGAKVSDTIRKGIIDVGPYNGTEEVLMVGNVAALTGSCVWLLIATFLRLPVSGTHSIVGATLGFALVANGANGINWKKLGLIVGSWFISPVMSGLVSVGFFFIIKRFILSKAAPLEPGLKFLPVIYAITVVINVFSIFYDGPELLGFDKIPLWGIFVMSFGSGIIVTLVVRFAIVPWQRQKIQREVMYSAADNSDVDQSQLTLVTYSATSSRASSRGNSRRPSIDKITSTHSSVEKLGITIENKKNEEKTVQAFVIDENNLTASNGQVVTSIINPNAKPLLPSNGMANGCLKTDTSEAKAFLEPSKDGTFDTEKADKTVHSDTSLLNDSKDSNCSQESDDTRQKSRDQIKDEPETIRLFSFLQVLTAVFGSFAHGGNDVSNAIGPLVGLWIVHQSGNVAQKAATPLWILAYGGVGISLGLWLWGRRVIKTLGEDLTKITPSSGFCIEIGSALTVLIASNIGIPISTTHCKVGSVVCVGRFRSRENVDWKLFRNIFLAWIVTLPISGGVSAAVFAGLRLVPGVMPS
ncbi:sodium-dependent phosphate transporter 1-B-like isoform X2 [Lineus longissimus]|uniref:sodium-dependent phosphate transporter 1-B-like isoform X2 n=1 Tax=Lineus longissimus TaxID=88925 RepID=UPI002B4E7AAA